jgi:hypothetical protein
VENLDALDVIDRNVVESRWFLATDVDAKRRLTCVDANAIDHQKRFSRDE